MNKELQGKVKEVDDPDDVEAENIDMNLPIGHYYRVMLTGAGFNVDICSTKFLTHIIDIFFI